MLYPAKTLKGYKLHARDGEIGKVSEFYFDDHHWTIRYLVAETGSWLTGKKVLLSPYVLGKVKDGERRVTVDLTKKKIESSPSLESDEPVSRQFEENYYGYYGMPPYWSGMYGWGYYPYLERNQALWRDTPRIEETWDPNLRSTHEVAGYHIEAKDGAIGHVEDFIIDDESWAIRYLVVNTQNWWIGRTVLISPQWIESVSWNDSKVFIQLTREAIMQSPEFTEKALVTREYEAELYGHYNRKGYWIDEEVLRKHFTSQGSRGHAKDMKRAV